MSVKIKNISISGIRGIKGELSLPLSEKSILIYGDNGTGKSSISDALEWYFTERVNHLASQEIDLKDALRNSSVSNDVQSSIKIDFSNLKYNSEKKLN
jgi:DNA repair exonuclease SbcCD ATPase subunit